LERNILFIINPISGTKNKDSLRSAIPAWMREKKIAFDMTDSIAGGDYSFLENRISTEKITDIVIAGGDGTISQVIAALQGFPVNFGILPCGSGNGLANAARIPRRTGSALHLITSGRPKLVDAISINGKLSCMLCGMGFDAKVAYDFATGKKRGLATYARIATKNFFSSKPCSFTLRLGEAEIRTEAYFISIANGNQFGNHFTIAPKASLSDGLLDVVIVSAKNKVGFAWKTLKQLAGLHKLQSPASLHEKKGTIYFQTDKLSILNHSLAPLHIDGDPAPTAPEFSIEIKKGSFRLLMP
jgi:diacylglycerol kinase (ATP)